MEDPDPSFAAPFEHAELRRQHCTRCVDAVASLVCSACNQTLCAACERHVHAHLHEERDVMKRKRSAKDVTDDESKGEPRAHHSHISQINSCQVCSLKPSSFLCVDCQTHQCEACCATRHLHDERCNAHLYFCVDGASTSLLRYARWSPEFLEMAKMQRRLKLQALEDARVVAATTVTVTAATAPTAVSVKQEAATVTAAAASEPTSAPVRTPSPFDPENAAAAAVVAVKTERPRVADDEAMATEPIHNMRALSIAELPSQSCAVDPSHSEQQHAPAATEEQQLPAPAPTAQVKSEPMLATRVPSPLSLSSVAPRVPSPPLSAPEPEASLPSLSPTAPVADASADVKSEHQQQAPTALPQATPAPTRTARSHHVVDLTEDDDDNDKFKHEPFRPSPQSFQPPAVKHERSAWLAAAAANTSSDSSVAASTLSDASDFALSDEDPIKRTMVSEYNRLSEVIFGHEQEMAAIEARTKELLADTAADMLEVRRCSDAAKQVRLSITKEVHSRNAVVARLVVYLKQDPTELQALLDGTFADIPHMQSASHRRCAQLEAQIREKRAAIRELKCNMEEAISMKTAGDPFAEVSRLGAMITAAEEEVHKSEDARLDELVRLFQFSAQIRSAARAMTR